jgi:adenylate cyclase
VPVGALAGRIALIGPVAPDAGARLVAGPFGPLSELERAATLIDNALTGRGLRRLAWADAALAAAMALAAAALARLLPPLPAPAALAALAAMGVQAALAALVAGSLALGLAPALLAAALCGLAGIVVRARAEGRLRLAHADRLTRWSPYVPPAVVQGAPQAVAALTAGRRQAATVLFADLRGFTGLSERLPPERTAALLRRVYGLIDAEVTRRGGTVTGFLGDGVMALFGLPEPRADDAVRALACARAIAERFAADPPAPGTPLAVALGLNTGPVLVAALGGRQFLQLTATGDTVNVAHRLQALAKAEGATLAAGGATVAAVSARPEGAALLAGLEARPAQALRGRQAPVAVWLWRRARVAVAG